LSRAFAIAAYLAVLATAGFALFLGDEPARSFESETANTLQSANRFDNLDLAPPEIAAEDRLVEPLPEGLELDWLTRYPIPDRSKVIIISNCRVVEDFSTSAAFSLPGLFVLEVQPHDLAAEHARHTNAADFSTDGFADILGKSVPQREQVAGRTVNRDYRVNDIFGESEPRKTFGLLRGMTPDELQFGCVRHSNQTEHALAQALLHATPVVRLDAAQQLWHGHSRYYADYVLKYVFDEKKAENKVFRAEVTAALLPAALAKEITDGDCEWGA
jgi:hypothetical protein